MAPLPLLTLLPVQDIIGYKMAPMPHLCPTYAPMPSHQPDGRPGPTNRPAEVTNTAPTGLTPANDAADAATVWSYDAATATANTATTTAHATATATNTADRDTHPYTVFRLLKFYIAICYNYLNGGNKLPLRGDL